MRTTAGVVLLALLAGCGGSSGAHFDSPRDLADSLGCLDYNEESAALTVADVGTCDFGGEQVTLVVGSDEAIHATVEQARDIAGTFPMVSGDGWAVLTETKGAASDARIQLGTGDVGIS